MTSILPPDNMPIFDFDVAGVEAEGRMAYDKGRALGDYDYQPGSTFANAYVRGWLQRRREVERDASTEGGH